MHLYISKKAAGTKSGGLNFDVIHGNIFCFDLFTKKTIVLRNIRIFGFVG